MFSSLNKVKSHRVKVGLFSSFVEIQEYLCAAVKFGMLNVNIGQRIKFFSARDSSGQITEPARYDEPRQQQGMMQ